MTREGRRNIARAEDSGFHAPMVRRGSKLWLLKLDERDPRRLRHPQTEWDILQGMLMAHEEGDIPVARAYLEQHAGEQKDLIRDLLDVWVSEMADEDMRKKAQELLFGL